MHCACLTLRHFLSSLSTNSLPILHGVCMELDDCAFPLLTKVVPTDDVKVAFEGSDIAILIGARPRGPGMTRADLLQANADIFKVQGKALNDYAKKSVKVLVVGNPANTVRHTTNKQNVQY